MLLNILEVFDKYLENNKNGLLDNYNLKKGIYIIVNNNGLDIYDIEYDKKSMKYYNNYSDTALDKLKNLDMLSNVLSTNKAVDNKKKIHSNNLYAFYIKRNTLLNEKILNNSIDLYYSALRASGAADKSLIEEFNKFNKTYGKINIDELEKNENWIKDNIYSILKSIKLELVNRFIKNKLEDIKSTELSPINKKIQKLYKEIYSSESVHSVLIETLTSKLEIDDIYLKIFFTSDIAKVKIENERYLLNRISLLNSYNTSINGDVYGVSTFNTSYNTSKKLYSINRSRPIEILNLKKLSTLNRINDLSLLLDGYGVISKNHILVGDFKGESNTIRGYTVNELNEPFNGFYINILKSKSLDVLDFEVVNYNPNINFSFIDLFEEDKDLIFENRKELLDYINIEFYNKFLTTNLFLDEAITTDDYLNSIIFSNKDFIKNVLIYGKDFDENILLKNIDSYIKYSFIYNKYFNVRKALSLKCSLLEKESLPMVKNIKDSIIFKLNEENLEFTSSEIQFLAGQLLSYYSKDVNNKKNKNMIVKLKSNNQLLSLLNKSFGHFSKSSKRGNMVYEYLIANLATSTLDINLILMGYVSNLIIFEVPEVNEDEYVL